MKQLALILALALPTLLFGQETVRYEYACISQTGSSEIIIIEGVDKYEVVPLKDEKPKSYPDTRPLLKRVATYEEAGWEVLSAASASQFILRRKKA